MISGAIPAEKRYVRQRTVHFFAEEDNGHA